MEQLENLTYEQYRNIAQDGDVIFLRGTRKSLVQFLIMTATGSKYCHVAFAFWVTIADEPRLMVVEAQGGTSRRILSASYYKDRTISVVRTPEPWHTISHDALSQVGKAKYSYVDAIWVGIREFMFKHFGLCLPAKDHCGEICSEFVARILQIEPTAISPGALYEKLRVLYPNK